MLNKLNVADYFILSVLGLSVVIGVWRGFLREVLSLAAWVAAFAVAVFFAEDTAAYLSNHVSVPSVRLILAFGGLFLATLFLGGVLNILVSQVVLRAGLSAVDRFIGVFFGALRAIAIVAVIVLLAGLTPLPDDPWWRQSQLLPYFEPLALWLRDLLPAEYLEYFRFPGSGPGAATIPL
jgi:membrane protein required for colicin V production